MFYIRLPYIPYLVPKNRLTSTRKNYGYILLKKDFNESMIV